MSLRLWTRILNAVGGRRHARRGSASQPQENWSNFALLRLNAYGLGINGVFLGIDTVVLPVLVLVLAPEGLKNTSLGVLGAGGLAVAALAQVLVGRSSDRTRSRLGKRVPYMLGGCAIVCLGIVGIALAPHYWVLFGVWMIVQAGLNIGYGPHLALIQDLVPRGRTGVASAIKILTEAVSVVILIWISSRLMASYDFGLGAHWLWAALLIPGATLVAATAVSSLTVLTRQVSGGPSAATLEWNEGTLPALHPQLRRFLVSRFMMVAPVFVFQTYGLFFLRDKVGLDDPVVEIGNMVLFIGAGIAVSAYSAGWASDRFGRKPVILAGSIAAAVSTWAMLFAGSSMEVLIIATVIGLSVGALLASNWAMANDMGTSGREAMHIGVVNLATIAGAASAKIIGPGVDLLNSASEASGYSALLIGCGAFFLIGGLVLAPIRPDLRRASV